MKKKDLVPDGGEWAKMVSDMEKHGEKLKKKEASEKKKPLSPPKKKGK